jgi:hypothetical protein
MNEIFYIHGRRTTNNSVEIKTVKKFYSKKYVKVY